MSSHNVDETCAIKDEVVAASFADVKMEQDQFDEINGQSEDLSDSKPDFHFNLALIKEETISDVSDFPPVKVELQDVREHSQQYSKQEDSNINETQSVVLFGPSKTQLKQFHNIQLDEISPHNEKGASNEAELCPSSSNSTFIKKCDLDQNLSGQSISEPASHIKEENTDLSSHKCVFSYNNLHDSDVIANASIKNDFPLLKDVSLKTTYCELCNKSLCLYMCEICKSVFTHGTMIENHMNSHVNAHKYECEICHKSFCSKQHLNNHVIIQKCDLNQDLSGQSISEPASHIKEENTDLSSHKCVFSCNSPRKSDVISNASIKSDFPLLKDVSVKTTYCEQCNKSLCLYMCEICKRVFTDETIIENHMNSHAQIYECEICHKSFSNKQRLNNHVIIHTEKQPYSCDVCNRSFNNSSNFIRHMLLHSEERPYKCEICHKAFVIKGELRFHMQTHTGERPYQCEICCKTYLRKTDLKKHIKIHKADEYKCEICNKAFTRKGYLVNHMYIHSGVSPNTCEVCNKSFTTRSSLVRHHLNSCIPK